MTTPYDDDLEDENEDWEEDEEADDDEEDDALAAEEAPEEGLEPWAAQEGSALDPYAERPAERALALAPLLDRGGRNLTWSSLRFLRGTGEEKLDLVLSLPDPARAVQAMAPEEFVFLIKEIGLNDAGDLLTLASPRQLQATIDLDGWLGSELDRPALTEWLLTAQDAGPEVLQRFVAAQDDGLLSLFLGKSLKVIVPDDDDPGDVLDDAEVFGSPDNAFQLVADLDDPQLPAIRALLAALYRQSTARGRALLLAVRWELPAQLEEDVLQLRNGRLADAGFLDRSDALDLYAYRDPHAWKKELQGQYRGTQVPETQLDHFQPYLPDDVPPPLGLALRDVQHTGFLGKVLEVLPQNHVERLRLGLVRLGYAVHSARAERPSQVDELTLWSRHALNTASMALEFLTDADVQYGVLLLRQVSLSELFSAGNSLVIQLQQRARRIRQQLGGESGVPRLESADAKFLEGLTQAFVQNVQPTRAGPVESLQELEEVRIQLLDIAAVVRLGQLLSGGDLRTSAPMPLRSLIGTAIAWQLVTGTTRLDPLDSATFQSFLRQAFAGPEGNRHIKPELRSALVRALLIRSELTDEEVQAQTRFLDVTLARLEEELGGLDPHRPLDLRYVGDSLRVELPPEL